MQLSKIFKQKEHMFKNRKVNKNDIYRIQRMVRKNTTGYETFIVKATNYQIEKTKIDPQKTLG